MDDPAHLSGTLQIGDLKVGPFMWLEMCHRADRAEFLLAIMAACAHEFYLRNHETALSILDNADIAWTRTLDAEARAQAAETALARLRERVIETLGPFAKLGRFLDRFAAEYGEHKLKRYADNFRAAAKLLTELTGGGEA